MRKRIAVAASTLLAAGALWGQSRSEAGGGVSFQPAYQLAVSGENHLFTYATIGGPVVTGRPYSATEERKSSQTLGDGTHIESSETNRLFRDDQGRTRTERKDGNISIYDPVEGFSAELNPMTKTATKMVVAIAKEGLRINAGGRGRGPSATTASAGDAESATKRAAELEKMTLQITELKGLTSTPYARAMEGSMASKQADEQGMTMTTKSLSVISGDGPTVLRVNPGNSGSVESLPSQMVNGVLAQGTRTTETIPVGKIGNDRVISIVSERWFSNDLQILIKSTSSDPRFGNTTYQLSSILLTSPDPSLFQIPADYTTRK